MLSPCVVMGDSIAVGVADFRPECTSVAQGGSTSERYVETRLQPQSAATIVISLGANDDATVHTLENLRRVRQAVHGDTVFWLLPGTKPAARASINRVAQEFGDRVIDTAPEAGPDHLHPTGRGYQTLAAATRRTGSLPVIDRTAGFDASGKPLIHHPPMQ